jgi:D-glycero-alpha-D-manno-heptose-7-phosphate kinase
MRLGNISQILQDTPIRASAPCRIDFGGTLDISTFHYALRHDRPATVNIALDRRTTVRLEPTAPGTVRISSTGVADAVFDAGTAPYDHPLGLMFAIVDYFGADGVHVAIHSTSPPRSGLGGSSVAAVALVHAFARVLEAAGQSGPDRQQTALVAHAIEQGVAGVPCGFQDQLAATFGGVNCWHWLAEPDRAPFSMQPLATASDAATLDAQLLVSYLGVTHVSRDVNNTWIKRFIAGKDRSMWQDIVRLTHAVADAIGRNDMHAAAAAMNTETELRRRMTPAVIEPMGARLIEAAKAHGCGARFTGAGGGGCLWAIGPADATRALRSEWDTCLASRPTAGLIDCRVDWQGVASP